MAVHVLLQAETQQRHQGFRIEHIWFHNSSTSGKSSPSSRTSSSHFSSIHSSPRASKFPRSEQGNRAYVAARDALYPDPASFDKMNFPGPGYLRDAFFPDPAGFDEMNFSGTRIPRRICSSGWEEPVQERPGRSECPTMAKEQRSSSLELCQPSRSERRLEYITIRTSQYVRHETLDQIDNTEKGLRHTCVTCMSPIPRRRKSGNSHSIITSFNHRP